MTELRPTSEETKHAEIAICPNHGSKFSNMNTVGKVYFCPIGGAYWRAGSKDSGMHAPLRWAKGL